MLGKIIANRSLENMAKLKYLGITIKNHNYTYEEIKNTLNSGSTCYHQVRILSLSI